MSNSNTNLPMYLSINIIKESVCRPKHRPAHFTSPPIVTSWFYLRLYLFVYLSNSAAHVHGHVKWHVRTHLTEKRAGMCTSCCVCADEHITMVQFQFPFLKFWWLRVEVGLEFVYRSSWGTRFRKTFSYSAHKPRIVFFVKVRQPAEGDLKAWQFTTAGKTWGKHVAISLFALTPNHITDQSVCICFL